MEIPVRGGHSKGMKPFTEHQRRLVSDLAESIFPRTPTMPSAIDVALSQDLLDDVFRARPDLLIALPAILEKIGDQAPSSFLSDLAAHDTASFSLLMQIVAGAYYMDRRVRAAIGYTGHRPIPLPDALQPSPAFAHHTGRDRIRVRSA